MSHSLPHLKLTPSISSLSPISSTSIIFPTVSPTHTIYGPRPTFTLRCSTAEWRINTNPISQIQERFMRNNHQQPITKDVDEFGKVGAEMSHLQSMIEVFHSSPNQTNRSKGQESQGNLSRNTTHHIKKKKKQQNPTKHVNLDLNFVDHVSSNVRSSRFGAMLYVFEDNEAVIMIIIKGRSPKMRHVPRTHRVALDWLFEWINLDPKIQTRFVDTKDQLADILTKGSFTRDEWNNLLHLFKISHFSSAENFSLVSCFEKMAKRMQEQKKKTGLWQNRSRRRWTWLPLSRQVLHPWTFRMRRKARGYSKHLQGNWREDEKKFETWRSVEFSRKAERCIPWRINRHSHGETCRYKKRIQEMWTLPNLKLGVKKMWQGNRLLVRQLRRNPMHLVIQTAREVQKLKRYNGHTICTCLQPQFTIRKQSARSSGRSTDENTTTLWMI